MYQIQQLMIQEVNHFPSVFDVKVSTSCFSAIC